MLPEAGGLNDQPAGLVARMRKAHEVWSIFDALRRAPSMKVFSEKYPEAWALKWEVESLRKAQGIRRKAYDAETNDRD